MSTDTKPFAVATLCERPPGRPPHYEDFSDLVVAGEWVGSMVSDLADQHVEAINAAVFGLLHKAAREVEEFANAWVNTVGASLDPFELRLMRPPFESLAAALLKLTPDGTLSVSGDVACGLAFDLGMEQAKTEGVMRPLIDYLLEKHDDSPRLAWALAEKAGLDTNGGIVRTRFVNGRSTMVPIIEDLTDEELLRECMRRGATVRRNGGAYVENWHESTGSSMRGATVDTTATDAPDAYLAHRRFVDAGPLSRYASGALMATAPMLSEPDPAQPSPSARQPPSGQQPPSSAATSKPRHRRR